MVHMSGNSFYSSSYKYGLPISGSAEIHCHKVFTKAEGDFWNWGQ